MMTSNIYVCFLIYTSATDSQEQVQILLVAMKRLELLKYSTLNAEINVNFCLPTGGPINQPLI